MSDIKYIKTTKDDMELLMKVRLEMLRKWTEADADSLFEYAKDPDVGPILLLLIQSKICVLLLFEINFRFY